MHWLFGFFLVTLFLPTTALATIEISEIAWMGDATSANNEWIELHNTGLETVSIDDWILSDGVNLNIILAGSVGAGQYIVLERNRSSESYINNPPFFIYTGALVNSGVTLYLTRSDGSNADTVHGGENWSFGGIETVGNNSTKETAQRTSNGWITAVPTPGTLNKTENSNPVVTTETNVTDTNGANITDTKSPKKNSPSSTPQTPKPVTDEPIQLKLIVPKTAYVNQLVEFDVLPAGITPVLLKSIKYEWNFGDLSVAKQKQVLHTYSYPGNYVVTLYGNFAKENKTVRQEITVLPVLISLTNNSVGDIQINNDAPYEMDVSGFTLTGSSQIKFPPRTVLLSHSTITVPKAMIATNWGQVVGLYDGKNVLVAKTVTNHSMAMADEAKQTLSATSIVDADYNRSTLARADDNEVIFANSDSNAEPDLILSNASATVFSEPASATLITEAKQSSSLTPSFGFLGTKVAEGEEGSSSLVLGENLAEFGGLAETEVAGVAKATPATRPLWPYLALIILLSAVTTLLFFTRKADPFLMK